MRQFSKKKFILFLLLLLLLLLLPFPFIFRKTERLPSEKYPYFLRVQKHRYHEEAKIDKVRLKKEGFPSFVMVVKGKSWAWFEVGVGPFKDKNEAEEYEKKMKEKGIKVSFASYEEVKNFIPEDKKLKKAVFKESEKWYEKAKRKYSKNLSKDTLELLPYHEYFKPDKIYFASIYDIERSWLKNIIYTWWVGSKIKLLNSEKESWSLNGEKVDFTIKEFAEVLYVDRIRDKKVKLFLLLIDNLLIDNSSEIKSNKSIKSSYGILMCDEQNLNTYSKMLCLSSDKKFVSIATGDPDDLEMILSKVGEGIFKYIVVRDMYFSSIPNVSPDDVLLAFSIDYVGEDYVAEKDYAEWARRMEGFWTIHTLFHNPKGILMVQLFDLLNEQNTGETYEIFSNEKRRVRGTLLYEFMKVFTESYVVPIKIRDKKGWYLDLMKKGQREKEISFYSGNYIVSVASEAHKGKILMRADLEARAKNLMVFD